MTMFYLLVYDLVYMLCDQSKCGSKVDPVSCFSPCCKSTAGSKVDPGKFKLAAHKNYATSYN